MGNQRGEAGGVLAGTAGGSALVKALDTARKRLARPPDFSRTPEFDHITWENLVKDLKPNAEVVHESTSDYRRSGSKPLYSRSSGDHRVQGFRMRTSGDPTVMAHELGHASGKFSLLKDRRLNHLAGITRNINRKLIPQKYAPIPLALAGAISSGSEGSGYKDSLDTAGKVVAGGSAALMAPTLFEEGRATLRGLGAIKRLGGNKALLKSIPSSAGSFGGYALRAAVPGIAYLSGKKITEFVGNKGRGAPMNKTASEQLNELVMEKQAKDNPSMDYAKQLLQTDPEFGRFQEKRRLSKQRGDATAYGGVAGLIAGGTGSLAIPEHIRGRRIPEGLLRKAPVAAGLTGATLGGLGARKLYNRFKGDELDALKDVNRDSVKASLAHRANVAHVLHGLQQKHPDRDFQANPALNLPALPEHLASDLLDELVMEKQADRIDTSPFSDQYKNFLRNENKAQERHIIGPEEADSTFRNMNEWSSQGGGEGALAVSEEDQENWTPLQDDGGGNYYMLNNKDNKVYLFDHEDGYLEPFPLFDSLADFEKEQVRRNIGGKISQNTWRTRPRMPHRDYRSEVLKENPDLEEMARKNRLGQIASGVGGLGAAVPAMTGLGALALGAKERNPKMALAGVGLAGLGSAGFLAARKKERELAAQGKDLESKVRTLGDQKYSDDQNQLNQLRTKHMDQEKDRIRQEKDRLRDAYGFDFSDKQASALLDQLVMEKIATAYNVIRMDDELIDQKTDELMKNPDNPFSREAVRRMVETGFDPVVDITGTYDDKMSTTGMRGAMVGALGGALGATHLAPGILKFPAGLMGLGLGTGYGLKAGDYIGKKLHGKDEEAFLVKNPGTSSKEKLVQQVMDKNRNADAKQVFSKGIANMDRIMAESDDAGYANKEDYIQEYYDGYDADLALAAREYVKHKDNLPEWAKQKEASDYLDQLVMEKQANQVR